MNFFMNFFSPDSLNHISRSWMNALTTRLQRSLFQRCTRGVQTSLLKRCLYSRPQPLTYKNESELIKKMKMMPAAQAAQAYLEYSRSAVPSAQLTNQTLTSLASIRHYERALAIFYSMKASPNAETYAIVIDMYAQLGEWNKASQFYTDLKSHGYVPNARTHNTLIQIHSNMRQCEKVLNRFNEMIVLGLRPSQASLSIISQICANSDDPERAATIQALLDQFKEPNATIHNSRTLSE